MQHRAGDGIAGTHDGIGGGRDDRFGDLLKALCRDVKSLRIDRQVAAVDKAGAGEFLE
jgi:hypothetical protein